jgi:uncharacterized sporulation protein YeaH/YhbH (DUF444 family)
MRRLEQDVAEKEGQVAALEASQAEAVARSQRLQKECDRLLDQVRTLPFMELISSWQSSSISV